MHSHTNNTKNAVAIRLMQKYDFNVRVRIFMRAGAERRGMGFRHWVRSPRWGQTRTPTTRQRMPVILRFPAIGSAVRVWVFIFMRAVSGL